MKTIKPRTIYFIVVILISAFILILLSSCNDGVNSPRGFSLPEGDSKAGKFVFLNHQCMSCHSISSLPMKNAELEPKDIEKRIALGGDVTKVKTYADLVTSIINPSHRIATQYQSDIYQANDISKMRNYNDVMTVTELINLVAFLQPHYELIEYHHTRYDIYP